MHLHTKVTITTQEKKEPINLRESESGYMEEGGGREGERGNGIIIF